jgi:hypothetical protein
MFIQVWVFVMRCTNHSDTRLRGNWNLTIYLIRFISSWLINKCLILCWRRRMSHRKFEHPRHGSLGFLPRKRAARHRGKGYYLYFYSYFMLFLGCNITALLVCWQLNPIQSFDSCFGFAQWSLSPRMTLPSLASLLPFWVTRLAWHTLSERSKNQDPVSKIFNLTC